MTQTVPVPLWLFAPLCALAALAVLKGLLLPGVRWYFRRKVRGVLDEISVRLNIELPQFKLTRRWALIDRLMSDPRVLAAAEAHAAAAGSNMDYILVSFLAAERVALSYAVGEWARIWPLQGLIRAMGAYFVRRGVPQAMYPEGGLTIDGRLREPKLGLLDYMLKGFNPDGERDLVFIPVGINCDRVIEDRSLLRKLDAAAPRAGLARTLTIAGA